MSAIILRPAAAHRLLCRVQRRILPSLALLGALAGASILVARLVVGAPAPTRPYTVAEARHLLAREPGHWLARNLVVRARAEPCPWWGDAERAWHCAGRPLVLIAADAAIPGEPLPLELADPNPLEAFAQGLPVLSGLVPRPAALPLYAVARFRIQLQVLPAGACGRPACYVARLIAVSRDVEQR